MKVRWTDHWLGRLRAGAGKALNVAMPPQCALTGELLERPDMISPGEWQKLQFIDDPVCPSCGLPFAVDYGAETICPSCIAEPPAFDGARAALVYDDISHDLIVRFKHGDRTDLAPMLADWMVRASGDLLHGDPLLIPIPLHPRRLIARRFNQSALLVNMIASKTGLRVSVDALKRSRRTPPQQSLSADARKRNVAGAFSQGRNARALRDARIVIVDDVLTTGATLSSAARVLKRAGAARVSALVTARVVKGDGGAI